MGWKDLLFPILIKNNMVDFPVCWIKAVISFFSKIYTVTNGWCLHFIFTSIRPMTTKIGRHVHLEELNNLRLIKQLLGTSSR